MFAATFLLWTLPALLVGQEPAPTKPAERRLVLVDEVVATVNDSAILLSEVRTLTAGRLRTAPGRLRREDIEMISQIELERLIDKHRMAQSAKTFGVATPEEVEALFHREVKREEQDQVRDLGSMQEVSKELKRQGRTWETVEREQRVEKMSKFAESFSVGMRLQQQSNLYLTPRMLRETYQREIDHFVRPAQAQVSLVSWKGDAMATATEAAAFWRDNELTSKGLAAKYPGSTALGEFLASSLVLELAEFALAGPANNVSAPRQAGNEIQVAKITGYLPARNGRFEDPDVQNELRDLCENRVVNEFRLQALERAKLRTEVWTSQPLR